VLRTLSRFNPTAQLGQYIDRSILDLLGIIDFDPTYDYKKNSQLDQSPSNPLVKSENKTKQINGPTAADHPAFHP
jgi:hypothetical protein